MNFALAAAAFSKFQGVAVDEEYRPRFREMILERGTRGSDNKIAVITLRGLISTGIAGNVGESMVDDMRWELEQARNDDDVRAVVLEVDSPGRRSDRLRHDLQRGREDARAKKPVVVYMESLAASGGYYVSCGGKYLMANDTSITGSIGVIIQTLNYEQLFNKIGLASVVFKSGKFKDMLNGARPITPEERDYIQGFVMKTYEKFLGIVAKERNLPADTLRNGIADGRILSGRDALENKLIDGLGQIEDAFAQGEGTRPCVRCEGREVRAALQSRSRLPHADQEWRHEDRAFAAGSAHAATAERTRLFSAEFLRSVAARPRDDRQPD